MPRPKCIMFNLFYTALWSLEFDIPSPTKVGWGRAPTSGPGRKAGKNWEVKPPLFKATKLRTREGMAIASPPTRHASLLFNPI